MSRAAWRIAAETPGYPADDMTGEGARRSGGRWNSAGAAAIYASESRALACLETLVHLKAFGLPLNRYLVHIEIPDDLWHAAERIGASNAPVGWDAMPAGISSIAFGTAWIARGTACLLLVPSAIVPDEQNVLINPAHGDAGRLTARKVRRWLYDPRLTG